MSGEVKLDIPEGPPEDFDCAICGNTVSNRFHYSPRDYERPPVCNSCETIKYYRWNGDIAFRGKPSGGSFRDRRNALRIDALADAIQSEVNKIKWSEKHGRP